MEYGAARRHHADRRRDQADPAPVLLLHASDRRRPVGTYGASPANPTYNFAPQKFYELEMKESFIKVHPDYAPTTVLRVRRAWFPGR